MTGVERLIRLGISPVGAQVYEIGVRPKWRVTGTITRGGRRAVEVCWNHPRLDRQAGRWHFAEHLELVDDQR